MMVDQFKKAWLRAGVDFVIVPIPSADHCMSHPLGYVPPSIWLLRKASLVRRLNDSPRLRIVFEEIQRLTMLVQNL